MKTDIYLLDALLESGRLTDEELEAFADMRERLSDPCYKTSATLSPKQRAWAEGCAAKYKIEVVTPAANEWSEKSPEERERLRGRPVPLPDVLKQLPLKPPGRGGGVRTQ